MMRTNSLLDPSSWRAWGGSGYTVRFADPYTLEPGTEAAHVCTVTNLPAGNVEDGCAAHGLFWSAYLQQFVVSEYSNGLSPRRCRAPTGPLPPQQ